MAYNRSIDLVLAAMSMQRSGKIEQAAVLFDRASSHESASSALNLLNAYNDKQVKASAKTVRASAQRSVVQSAKQRLAVTAMAWPFRVNATVGQVGEELHVEVEENDLREVQEADFEEDFLDMGLDDASDEELILSAADDEDDEEDDDKDEEEDEEEKEEDEDDKKSESARFTRTLRNLQASRALAAAKKPAAKKKAPFGGKQAKPFTKKK